jgi:hypothetical protein
MRQKCIFFIHGIHGVLYEIVKKEKEKLLMLCLNVIFGWCRKTAEHCGVAGPEYPDELQVCGGQPL